MVHFSQGANEIFCEEKERGLSVECVAWLRSAGKDELDFYLTDWMKLPSYLNDVEDFSNLVFSTLQYFSRIYKKRILSLQENFVLAIEVYDWPGGYLEWFQSISRAVSRNQTGNLTLGDFPEAVLERISRNL